MSFPGSARAMGFVNVRDRTTAKLFYGDVLGFALVAEDDFAAVYDMGGLIVRVSTVESYMVGAHPVLGWGVTDISEAARALRGRGVTFLIYPGFGQDELGIWSAPDDSARVSCFNDPEGNMLSLTQFG